MTRKLNGVAVRTAIQFVAILVAAFSLFTALPSYAQDAQVAEIQPIFQAPSIAAESLTPRLAIAAPAAAAPTLTPEMLAAYVARQQAQKGFNIFGETQAPPLTSALLSAYAATHYQNAALAAIDTAAAPTDAALGAGFDVPPVPTASSTIDEQALARYAHVRFEPTDKKIAHANDERLCLTKAIYHEARGESDNGQWAVANVIINRAMSKRFPTTMCGVIYQNANQGRNRCQFSFACDGQPDMASERQAWIKANHIAAAAFSEFQHGQRPGVLPGSAMFYHTRAVSPDWSNTYKRVAQIGAHVFYAPM